MLTKDDILMGRDKQYPKDLTQEILDNIEKLLLKINELLKQYPNKVHVHSGWRPAAINAATPGSAKKSTHMLGLSVDLGDESGELRKWVISNLDKLKACGLYCEDFRWTPTWVHFQIVAPTSGNRIYVPSAAPALALKAWSGSYNKKFN